MLDEKELDIPNGENNAENDEEQPEQPEVDEQEYYEGWFFHRGIDSLMLTLL